jgi:hypothetical protein
MEAQTTLFWAVLVMSVIGLSVALLWQWRHDDEYDWVERLARALFVALQCTIWGNVVAFIALDALLGFNFGGSK